MRYLEIKDVDNLIPSNINLELAKAKGLANDKNLNDNYLYVYSIYYHYLEKYLGNLLNLQEYEKIISAINNIEMIDDEEKDIYQYLSENKYMYIRNTLHIERLSQDIINTLLGIENDKIEDNYPKFKDVIKDTYKEVIKLSDDSFTTNYGPEDENYFASSNDLVLGIRINDSFDTITTEEGLMDKYEEAIQKIEYIKHMIKEDYQHIVDDKISIIEYDEFSVIRRNNSIIK